MSRQHLAVRVNIDAFALGLFKKQLQVMKIMSGNDDERTFFDIEGNFRGSRRSVCPGIGLVQKSHALQVDFPGLQDKRKQRIHRVFLSDGKQGTVEEIIDLPVCIAEDHRMIAIGSHAAESEKDQ